MDIWEAKRVSTAELTEVIRVRELQIARLRAEQMVAISELSVRRVDGNPAASAECLRISDG